MQKLEKKHIVTTVSLDADDLAWFRSKLMNLSEFTRRMMRDLRMDMDGVN